LQSGCTGQVSLHEVDQREADLETAEGLIEEGLEVSVGEGLS
jgi:hypothetical protein